MRIDNLIKLCEKIGNNVLFVQGAGGNISVKNKDTLMVKASGQRLSEASKKNIFVSVNQSKLINQINKGDFNLMPEIVCDSNLRPSIETLMHSVIPSKYVVHLHAVEILSVLVRHNAKKQIHNLLNEKLNYKIIDYYKPGVELAIAIKNCIDNSDKKIDWFFLINHGIVLCYDDIEELEISLFEINQIFRNHLSIKKTSEKYLISNNKIKINNFKVSEDNRINSIVFNETYINRLHKSWKICPDHIVFLGLKPVVINKIEEIDFINLDNVPFIFINKAVYQNIDINLNQIEQLICFYEVISRQSPDEKLLELSDYDCKVLLDWDMEKYRQALAE